MAINVTASQGSWSGLTTVVSGAITDGDTGDTVQCIEVPAGTFIPPYGVSLYVAEAFAGGTPLLDVGDGADVDGWVDQTENTATSTGWYSGTASAYAVAGKYYSAADTIDVVVSASLTDGTAYVVVQMIDMNEVDLSASS